MKRIIIACLVIFVAKGYSQTFFGENPLAHTYSIVAIDEKTGDMGVAVQSHWFGTGTIVTWGEAGVGVVATQSLVNPAFGPDGLALMKMGFNAQQALETLVNKDPGKGYRQVAFLDHEGRVKAFTGDLCIEAAGHQEGQGYSVQANMKNETVWPAMAEAFEKSETLPFAERLLAALIAAENAGGDIRGKQSAAILIVSDTATGQSWVDRKMDLRVDDHPAPLEELARLLKVHQAYQHMNAGDLAIERGDFDLAMKEYGAAEKMFPDNLEMKYWHAVSLANIGMVKEALPVFKDVFAGDDNWRELTRRIVKNGLLTVEKDDLDTILSQ